MNDELRQRENSVPAVASGVARDPGGQPQPINAPTKPRKSRGFLTIAVVAVAAVGILGFVLSRNRAGAAVETVAAAPSVAVAKVVRDDLYNEVTIPGEFRPYMEAELHAKVSGYLDKISVDFGDKVKAGQLLAVLEIPELQDELNASVAAEQRAEADYTNAHLIYARLAGVDRDHPNLVAQQDIDTAQAKDSVAMAAVAAAKADAEKFRTLFDYTRITAPFDGVITRRYADPGALIQGGTSSDTQAHSVVRLSDNYRLRLDFPVSVEYVKDVHPGDSVSVRVTSLAGKAFTGTIARFTDRVSEDTRTMITEIEVANPTLEIVPGMYAVVVLRVERHPNTLTIPTEAVATGSKDTVYTVNQDNKIEEHEVKLGLETPTRYEVTSGLKEGDRVMIGNRSQVHVGESVEPKPWAAVVMN